MSSAAVKLAMIGNGPSALYLLKHALDEVSLLKRHLEEIVVFEKRPFLGMGMACNPVTTDRFNLANIASEEVPPLYEALVDRLGGLAEGYLPALIDRTSDELIQSIERMEGGGKR